jgi:hypothetical protein
MVEAEVVETVEAEVTVAAAAAEAMVEEGAVDCAVCT